MKRKEEHANSSRRSRVEKEVSDQRVNSEDGREMRMQR
jgi:hypothetical protein